MWLHIQSTVPSAGAVCSLLDVGWSGQDTPATKCIGGCVCHIVLDLNDLWHACHPTTIWHTLLGLLWTPSLLSLTHTSHSGWPLFSKNVHGGGGWHASLQYATHQSVIAAKMCCVKSHVFPSRLLEKARVIKLHTSIAAVLHAFWVSLLFSSLSPGKHACMAAAARMYPYTPRTAQEYYYYWSGVCASAARRSSDAIVPSPRV